MRVFRLVLAVLAVLALAHCAAETDEREERDVSRAALCYAEWNPTWQVAAEANEWWVELVVGGGDVASAYLEVPGQPDVTLSLDAWGKWVGVSSARIPNGTPVVAHARNAAGQRAQTRSFPWLGQPTPTSDPCAPAADAGADADAGDSGSCANAWTPIFEQGENANQWWVEFYVSGGAVRSARLDIVGGGSVALTSQWGKWAGSYGAGIPTGTSVVLRVEDTAGVKAESVPFRYRVDTRPAAKPCTAPDAGACVPQCGGKQCGDDGCGGTCGACGDGLTCVAGACTAPCGGWSPTWRQETGANTWWIEYAVSGSPRAVRLQIVGGASVNLTSQWGKWVGAYGAGIPTGTSVVLHAESQTGQKAETQPFRYMVDTTPVTKPCAAPGDVGLDVRPSNATCLAPPRPGTAATVGLTPVYGDVFTAPNAVQGPMIMAQRPGDGSRWFLAQRDGRIVSFNAAGGSATRDLRTVVSQAQLQALTGKAITLADEGGFHGMAFDPDFANNGRLYVSFSTTCDGAVPLCDDPKNLNGDYYKYASEIGYLTSNDGGQSFQGYTRLLHVGRWAQMHYAGSLAFGKDGYLYISSGDGLDDSAVQYKDNFFGKVLRIDVKGPPAPGKSYGIPPTNPFAGGGGRPEIYAWGLRNPFRMTVDRLTGDVWLGDVGQDTYEEVNRIQAGGNYGWPCREGAHQGHGWNDAFKCPSKLGFIDPVMEHLHVGIGRSVTGGYVYRGAAIAGFQGTYVYGDFMQKELRALTLENGVWTSRVLNGAGPQDGYVSFAEDGAGEIYAVSLFDQKIHKLVPAGGGAPVAFPELLSQTGCFQAADPTKPTAGVIPFDVNAPLWSDAADKQRWLAIPDGTKITVRPDGDFEFPVGAVLIKQFTLGGRRVETRLFVRHADGEWGGYSYEWNDAQTDATLLPSGKVKDVGGQSWTFPSRSECGLCHTAAAGRSLGPEIGQLNGSMLYPSTGRTANQLRTLEHIGLFDAPIGDPAALPAYPKPFEGPASEAKARAYLHSNCSSCHRPSGGAGRSTMDLRFATPFASTNTCNVAPIVDDFGDPATRLIAPGSPAQSIVSLRMHTTDARAMPPLARTLVDPQGTALVDAWIGGLGGCGPAAP